MSNIETIIQSLDQAKRRMQWEQFQQQQTLVRAKTKEKSSAWLGNGKINDCV